MAPTERASGRTKTTMRLLAEALLPFYRYFSREAYDLWDLALDVERLAFLFLVSGLLVLLTGRLGLGVPTMASFYALRNVAFYLIASLPILIPSLRRHRPGINALIRDLETKPAGTRSGIQKLLLLGLRCFSDRQLVVIAMLPLALATLNNVGEWTLWGAWVRSFEARYAIGPSIPQHVALGFALSRVTRTLIARYREIWQPGQAAAGDAPLAKAQSRLDAGLIIGIPWVFMLTIEAYELALPAFFSTCPPDLVMDLVSGFGGQLLERWSFARTHRAHDPALARIPGGEPHAHH